VPRPLSALEQSLHFLNRPHRSVPDRPVASRAAWRASDLGSREGWFRRATPELIAALERALGDARKAGHDERTLQDAADFALPELALELADWREELARGRGFVLLRGLPTARWAIADARLVLLGLMLQLGRPGAQNAHGDIVGEVRNTGAATVDPFARNYATDKEFRFHCDAADLLGLLCIRPAVRGGRSRISSSVSVFNELLQRRPNLARRLFSPLRLDLRNEQAAGGPPVAPLTPCAYADGALSTLYVSDYFRSIERHPGEALSADERELLDLYDELAASPEMAIAYDLEPGDVQLVNNHVLLHARDAFDDAPGRERLLLRVLASVGA
jgi:hypothetical protein